MKLKLLREIRFLKEQDWIPSSYTLSFTGFQTSNTFDENHFIESIILKNYGNDAVTRSVFCYNLFNFFEFLNTYLQCKRDKAMIDRYRISFQKFMESKDSSVISLNEIYPAPNYKFIFLFGKKFLPYNEIVKKIQDCEEKLDKYSDQSIKSLPGISKAFITFKTANLATKFFLENETTLFQRFKGKSKLSYQGKPVYVDTTPEPDDIIFENIHSSAYRRTLGHFVTSLFCILLF